MSAIIRAINFPRDASRVTPLMDRSDLASSPELSQSLDSGAAFSFVAELDGHVIGWLVVHTKFRPEYGWVVDADTVRFQSEDNAYLEIINVAVASRSRGIGKRLLQAAEATAKLLGKSSLWLHVREDNTGAIRFYEREQWSYEYTVTPEWQEGTPMRVYRKSLIGRDFVRSQS